MTVAFSLPYVGRCLLLVVAFSASLLLLPNTPVRGGEPRLPADLQGEVNKAIDRGKYYLLATASPTGTWPSKDKNHPLGYSAFPALVLLECGVPKTDPRVQAAAAYTRQKCVDHKGTYEISLSVLLLDKLGYKEDRWLIEMLALRLMSGQSPSGGWSYKCPYPKAESIVVPKGKGKTEKVKTPGEWLFFQEQQIHAVMLQLLRMKQLNYALVPPNLAGLPTFTDPARLNMADPEKKQDEPTFGTTDGSNTQFAILALWAARRHGVPVKRSLDLVVKRYETSQNKDGSWGYHYKFGGGEPGNATTMTNVGLLGLAVGYGMDSDQRIADMPAPGLALLAGAGQAGHVSLVPATLTMTMRYEAQARQKRQAQAKDTRIPKGLAYLAKNIGTPAGRFKDLPQQNLYFLWSVERVGVLYGLPTIAKKDWYRWGCEILVANQKKPDGHWQDGQYHGNSPVIDTCLALLFLKRANFATDLAQSLPFDPDTLNRDIVAQLTPVADPNAKPTPVVETPTPGRTPSPVTDPGVELGDPSKLYDPDKSLTKEGEDKKAVSDPNADLLALANSKAKGPRTPVAISDTEEEEGGGKKPILPLLIGGGVSLLLLLLLLLLMLLFLLRKKDKEHKKPRRSKLAPRLPESDRTPLPAQRVAKPLTTQRLQGNGVRPKPPPLKPPAS